MIPTFLIIGAARCATTSLHTYLGEHPGITLSDVKEINYFSNDRFWKKGQSWYEGHFRNSGTQAIGEASTSYTAAVGDDDRVPARIRATLGDIPLVYIVRDPVSRLRSHMLHRNHRGMPDVSIETMLSHAEHSEPLWQGRYHHQLQLYLRHFQRSNLLVLSIEQLKGDSNAVLREIHAHIGVAPHLSGAATGAERPSRNSTRHNLAKGPIGRAIRSFYNQHVEQRKIPFRIKKLFLNASKIDARPLVDQPLSADEKQLLREFYLADARALERDFGIDTARWPSVQES